MMKTSLELTRILVFSSIVFVSNSAQALLSGWDNEICALYEGSTCEGGTEMFYMHMGSGTNSTNRQRCESLPAICKAPDIDRWVAMFRESGGGRRGYRSGYSWSGTQVTQDGTLVSASGKTYVRCFKNRRRGDWVANQVLTCGGAIANVCTHGKVLINNECKSPDAVLDTDNSNSVHSFGVAQSLHALAGQHDNGHSQIIVNPDQALPPVGVIPGINGNLGDLANVGGSNVESKKKSNSLGDTTSGAFNNPMLSTALVNAKTALSGNGGPFSTGGEESAGTIGSSALRMGGGQSISGNPDPGGEGGSNSISVKGDRSLAAVDGSGDETGKDGASSKLGSQDPEDYFTRIGLSANLFTIVTTRLRQEQADWILSSSPPKSSVPQRKAASAR